MILCTREFLVYFFKNQDGDFTNTFQIERWQIYQSHKMFTRMQNIHGIQKLRVKRWQSQTIWKCEKRSNRNIWRFSCPRESKEFEAKIFYSHNDIMFENLSTPVGIFHIIEFFSNRYTELKFQAGMEISI